MENNITKKPGLIVNDGIFYNPDHIIEMTKYDNDISDTHWIEIHMSNGKQSTLSFATKEDRDASFSEIIKRLYGEECAVFDYQKGKYIY
jgi:hypothetical protein